MVSVILGVTACGADTEQSALNQQRDRERVTSVTQLAEYSLAKGVYQTVVDQDASPYLMQLELNTTYVHKDGALTDSPTLTGNLRMFNKSAFKEMTGKVDLRALVKKCDQLDPDANDSNCGYFFTLSAGTYDKSSRILHFYVQAYGISGIDVSCLKVSDLFAFQCDWTPSAGGSKPFRFMLSKSL